MARAIDIVQVKREIQAGKLAVEFKDSDVLLTDKQSGEAVCIATLTPPNEWVSVKDTVPDPGERVLATDGIFVGEAYRTSADSWNRHTGFPWRDGVTERTVKYWMLLPAPPAKEDQK